MGKTTTGRWHEIPSVVPTCRAYQRECGDGHLSVFVGREPAGNDGALIWHMSISHRKNLLGADGHPISGRLPTWGEIKDARYTFCPDELYMAMILPPKAQYVNIHETTMHLWEISG